MQGEIDRVARLDPAEAPHGAQVIAVAEEVHVGRAELSDRRRLEVTELGGRDFHRLAGRRAAVDQGERAIQLGRRFTVLEDVGGRVDRDGDRLDRHGDLLALFDDVLRRVDDLHIGEIDIDVFDDLDGVGADDFLAHGGVDRVGRDLDVWPLFG